jgi:hypothetical protein
MQSRPKLRSLAVLTLLVVPVCVGAQTTYGAGVTLAKATAFTTLLERPNTLEGQTVRVDGVITSVCATAGCGWIGMSGSGGSDYGNSVFVRFDGGKIVFPKSAVGQRVSVEGVILNVARDPDPQTKEIAAEFGRENLGGGAPFWELKATGAVIQ